jgi:hypothetical protein
VAIVVDRDGVGVPELLRAIELLNLEAVVRGTDLKDNRGATGEQQKTIVARVGRVGAPDGVVFLQRVFPQNLSSGRFNSLDLPAANGHDLPASA